MRTIESSGAADVTREGRPGFTTIELVVASTILLLVASMAIPPIAARVSEARANDAARVVASDLRHAVELAVRQGTPVRIEFDATGPEIRLRDRGGTVLHRRVLGAGTEFPVASASASPSSVFVYPTRIASGPLVITLVTPARSKQVVMSRATFIQIEDS